MERRSVPGHAPLEPVVGYSRAVICGALRRAGGRLEDVVRTRINVVDEADAILPAER